MKIKWFLQLTILPMLAIVLAGCSARDTTGRSIRLPFFGSNQSQDPISEEEFADTDSAPQVTQQMLGSDSKREGAARENLQSLHAQQAAAVDRLVSRRDRGVPSEESVDEKENFAPIVRATRSRESNRVSPASGETRLASSQRKTPVLMTLAKNDSLAQVINNAPGVVLIDFYADWCGPCKTQGRILHAMEETAAEHHATIVKVNVEQHKDLASKYKVKALPTLVVLNHGKLVSRQTGLADRKQVASYLSSR